MEKADRLIRTIEAVHAAGLDETLWPVALRSVTDLIGARGTTFEVVDKSTGRLSDFWSFGIPPGDEIDYIDHFVTINPRMPLYRLIDVGDIGYDSLILDEAAMNCDPYYCEFLPRMGLRYFVSTFLINSPQENVTVAAQRSPAQGHAGKREIALMRALTPHLRQAFDVTRRLRGGDAAARSLERALDWLADGAALIRRDGRVLYANEPLRAMSRRNDGIRIGKGRLEFAAPGINARYAQTVASVGDLLDGEVRIASHADFAAPRQSGGLPYLVSVRPLVHAVREARNVSHADVVLFVRDPMHRQASTVELLRDTFGFTAAEASLAQALQADIPLAEYAAARRLSLNTVYTHLRRIKDKTGCRRMTQLIRKLNDLQVPLRWPAA